MDRKNMPRKRKTSSSAPIHHIPTTKEESIIRQSRSIQKNTLEKMIQSKNPTVKLQNIPINLNYKLVLVNDQQQDMFLCTQCSQLEFMDKLQNHSCASTSIKGVDTTPIPLTTSNKELPKKDLLPTRKKSDKRQHAKMMEEKFVFSLSESPVDVLPISVTTSNNELPKKDLLPTKKKSKKRQHAKMMEEQFAFSLGESLVDVLPQTVELNKIHPRNIAIMKEQLAFSFAEMFPLEAFNDIGFKAMTKYLMNIGATHGKINVKEVLADQMTVNEERKSLVSMAKIHLRKIVADEKLVFSCDVWKHPLYLKTCITLSSHYVDDDFVLHRNVLGTRIFNENEFDGSMLASYVTDILGEYTSTPSSILSNATIVTSNSEDFVKSFKNYGRLNCMCTILNDVVNHSLALPCFETENVCKAITIRLNRQSPNGKYENAVANLQLNDWFSIWHLFEAYQQYLTTTTPCKNIIPGYEILYKFLSESQKASKLLSSNSEATVSFVCLIKKKLIDVMRGYNYGSFRWPEFKDKLTSYAENTFEITDVHRITLFLDPRYKSLKILSKAERDAMHETVRGIIGELFTPDENMKEILNLGDHVAWVDANGMAEVDNYLNLTNISPDTNVLEFWKSRVDFPKLRTLAKEMLCIPAVSAAWECYFNEDKFNLSRRRLHLSLDELDTTLLLNGFNYCDLFDEELKSLFEPLASK